MPMYYWYGWDWGGALLMVLGMLFWFALLGVLLWAAIRWANRHRISGQQPQGPSAREILEQRYARGEIDAATYDDMRAHLEGRTAVPGEPVHSAS